MTNLSFSNQGTPLNRPSGTAFELGLSRTGRADFFIGGERYTDLKAKFGIAPLGVAALAAAGVVVVGATLAGSSGGSTSPNEQKKQHEVVCLGIGVCPPPPKPGG